MYKFKLLKNRPVCHVNVPPFPLHDFIQNLKASHLSKFEDHQQLIIDIWQFGSQNWIEILTEWQLKRLIKSYKILHDIQKSESNKNVASAY